ncbi:MAG: tyrosine-type recombinase/integrase [Rickettsiales bacterium]|nr:tyrosine-type recombinase/integrase [Pseudomonadota bacterium]MDA0966845.1 tyrosine-type recombinase/integrase [Pseudomonadota bacterium]MDG4543520.1 tyrosine-type recombinase/integrase [Rickettsiales bacterium]MDG4545668.1 tyrosine-type recombinase/integrase [Rickettsiales bacterium]MDG4547559.1 tyrosine-type recombinase/integrase [Rickettsiales bacterium]
MPKRNKENKGLPKRWQYKHNAYYYRVPVGQEHLWDWKTIYRLGKTLSEAHREYANKVEIKHNANTIGDLLDEYAIKIIPFKAPKTRKDNYAQLKRLKLVFGEAHLIDIKPMHIYRYYNERAAKVAAKREIALLSHAFTVAVEWGYLSRHPFKGQVTLKNNAPRDRYIEDWEIEQCSKLTQRAQRGGVLMIQAYINLKLLTGLRKTDLLKIELSDITNDGLYVQTSKTSKKALYLWTDDFRAAIKTAKTVRPVDISKYLFCTKYGKSYLNEDGTTSGFDSMWQRFMKRLIVETDVNETFTEHDLRAKAASDLETDERAQELLGHSNVLLTKKVYRRKLVTIMPTR